MKGLGDEFVVIKCMYSRGKIILPGKKTMTSECLLDIKSFEGTDVSDNNWDKKAAKEVEKIAKAVDQIASGLKALTVFVKDDS